MKRSLLFGLLAAFLAGSVVPAGAQTSDVRSQQQRMRARKAQLAAQLNTLRASERQLLAAATALDDQVLAQAARVDAARQAVAAAEREAAENAAAAARTRSQITRTKRLLVQRAVRTYIEGDRNESEFAHTNDLADAARREVLLAAVTANEDDLIDELHASEEDYEVQRATAEAAAVKARARRAETENRLRRLESDRQAQRRLRAAVTTRQREVLAEITAQSRAESELNRIIAERTAESRRRAGTPPNVRGTGACIWPTQGRVTSEYGRRSGRQHQGMDIGAASGSRISAAKSGVVVFAGQQSGYGNVIVIDHGDMSTLYAHQSRLAASDGETVSQGDQIGYVGNTGRSTGPHLHFETRYGGSPRNPRTCLP